MIKNWLLRVEKKIMPKLILSGTMPGKRKEERPKRWINGAKVDVRKLGINNIGKE